MRVVKAKSRVLMAKSRVCRSPKYRELCLMDLSHSLFLNDLFIYAYMIAVLLEGIVINEMALFEFQLNLTREKQLRLHFPGRFYL